MRVTGETKQTTQARLLSAAANEFGRVGFERASIDAISTAAGYGKGTVYNYFASKEELFAAVVDAAAAEAAVVAARMDGGTARERLSVVLGAFCAWARERDALARVLVRECLMGTPSLYPRVIAAEQPLIGALEAILHDGASAGELRDDLSPGLLAVGLAGLVDLALVRSWASDGADLTIEQIPALVVQALLGPEEKRTG